MDILHDELHTAIFSFMSPLDLIKIERVSKRWQRLSRKCWKSQKTLRLADVFERDDEFLDVRDCNRVLAGLLLRSGPFLHSLDLSDSFCSTVLTDLTNKSFRLISRYCPNITLLDLSYLSINNGHLAILGAEITLLESLILIRSFEDEDEPDVGLAPFLVSLKYLRYLDLSLNDTLTGDCLLGLNPDLSDLRLNRCTGVTAASLALMSRNCCLLNRLELSGYVRDPRKALLNLRRLEHLNLNSFEKPMNLSTVSSSLGSLKTLDLGHSPLVTNAAIQVIAKSCPRLESLNVAGKFGALSNVSLSPLKACRELRHLDISWLEHLSDEDLLPISKSGLLETVQAHLCDNLSSEGLCELVKQSPALMLMDVTGSAGVSLEFIRRCSLLTRKQPRRKSPLVLLITQNGLEEPYYVIHCFSHKLFEIRINS